MSVMAFTCAVGDAPAVTLSAASTVAIGPPDNSVDTNHIIINGSGTINSFGVGTLGVPVTKTVNFQPAALSNITLTETGNMNLLGAGTRVMINPAVGTYQWDGSSVWNELSFTDLTVPPNVSGPIGGGGGGGGVQPTTYLPLAGGTMTGPIVLAADPTTSLQPATKQYADASPYGYTNKIRNSGMDIWQRGSPISCASGSNNYTADGWRVAPTGAIASVSVGSGLGGVSDESMIITGNTSMTALILSQRIESYTVAALAGDICTFQARIQNNTGAALTPQLSTFYPTTQDNFGTIANDLPATNLQTIPVGAIAVVTYTFQVNASAIYGYGINLSFGSSLNANTKNVVITDVDLRSTPAYPIGIPIIPPIPEVRPWPIEQSYCQSYYCSRNSQQAGFYNSGSLSVFPVTPIFFPVPMRSTPTINFTNLSYSNASSASAGFIASDGFTLKMNTPSGTQMAWVQFGYTASAEL